MIENDQMQKVYKEKKNQTHYSLDLDDVKREEKELSTKKSIMDPNERRFNFLPTDL